MPAWIHDRAQHLLAKNPKMSKSQAFAIANQQSHALGKSPKGYGTVDGRRTAREKYDEPKKGYIKTPNPGNLSTPKLETRKKISMDIVTLAAMRDEIEKIAYAALTPAGRLRRAQSVGRFPGSLERSTPSLSDQVKPKGPGFGGRYQELIKEENHE